MRSTHLWEKTAQANPLSSKCCAASHKGDAGTNQYDWIKDKGANYALLVGSVAQDSYSIGYKAVELAAKKLAGEAVADVGITGRWYNADNIDELKDQNIFYMG